MIKNDLASKIILLTGPRQFGKTTLSRILCDGFDYFNFDNPEHWLELQLHYLRTKDGREIDFFVTDEGSGKLMLEVKWADANRSRNFSLFDQYIPGAEKVQLVKELKKEKTYPDGAEVRQADFWLSTFSL